MHLSQMHRKKSSEVGNLTKNKKRTETRNGIRDKSNFRENMDTSKKSHTSASMNTHHKSDTDKSLQPDGQEKGSGDPLVYEMKDFAGVTIILRAAPNTRTYGNSDAHGKAASRRKSEFQQSQLSIPDKYDYDRSGANSVTFSAKSESSTNETSSNNN